MVLESPRLKGKAPEPAEAPAIVVSGLTKRFMIPHERRTTIFESILGIFRPSTYEKLVALDDVSFTVKRGEAVGIIGNNGSGKSTLLKLLAGILRPTGGNIVINGRVTPFLELGVGFQPELTARENIDIYSAIMGLPEKEIQRNIDGVLEFAGLTNFRDAKLKNLSSGMQVRLAFSTAIQVRPDILIVDEVLAVGDMAFQQKCLDVFTEYRKAGVTILFVSHDLSAIRQFCDRTLFLKNGRLVAIGETNEIIDTYVYDFDRAKAQSASLAEQSKKRWGNGDVEITRVMLVDKFDNENDRFNSRDSMRIRIFYRCKRRMDDIVFGIAIYTDNDVLCFGTNTDIAGVEPGSIEGEGIVEARIGEIPMISGKYMLSVTAHSKNHIPYDWHDKEYAFSVIPSGKEIGLFNVKCSWAVPWNKS